MPTPIEDLVQQLLALSPSERKAVRDTVWPRKTPGPVPPTRELVHEATKTILEDMTTIDGVPFDDWLMKLTPEKIKALQRPPAKNRRLSLDTWKYTTEGWAVFKQEGQEKFEAWANDQTEKLKKWKGLTMKLLLDHVEHSLGSKRRTSRKGAFLHYVREAKDDFLIDGFFSWQEIPPTLRGWHQPGIRGDCRAFYQRQEDFFNKEWPRYQL